MKLAVPALLALAAGTTALAAVEFPKPGRSEINGTLRPVEAVETVTVGPGTLAFRLPGEYLKANWPVDAPIQKVEFRHGFDIMKYQVTAADYEHCVSAGACEAAEGRAYAYGNFPVTGVSYRDATSYAAWLSAESGESWRLPSDEEWAFAAAERLHDDALGLESGSNPAARWLARYRAEARTAERDTEPKVLGYFGVNAKGLADVGGNVWEWTTTCYLHATLATDGRVVQSGDACSVRVVDGRHRGYMSTFIRDAKSGGCAAGLAPDNLGIRLVREPASLLTQLWSFWERKFG